MTVCESPTTNREEPLCSQRGAKSLGIRSLVQSGQCFDYFLLMGSISVCWFGVSCLTPYLNPWCRSHGLSAAQAGAIFSVQPFANVCVQGAVPWLCKRLGGASRLLVYGHLVGATALTIFALVPMHGPNVIFATLLSAGVIAGIGEGIVETCVYTLLQDVFPECVGQAIGHSEAWVGLGTIGGPALGGLLFQVAGFSAPVGACAFAMLLFAALAIYWIRASREEDGSGASTVEDDEENAAHHPDKIVFAFTFTGIVMAGFSCSSLGPLASLYWIDSYGISESAIGYIFAAYGVLYLIVAMLVGRQVDRSPRRPRVVITTGVLGIAVGVTLFGWPDLPVTISIVGMVLTGFGDACVMVAGMGVLSQSTPKRSNEFTSACLNAGFALGAGIGPLVTVPLEHAVGLSNTTIGMASVAGALGLTLAGLFLIRPIPGIRTIAISSGGAQASMQPQQEQQQVAATAGV